jgi:hypothetical protein
MSQLRTNSIVPVGGLPAGANGGGIIQCVYSLNQTQTAMSPGSTWTEIPGWSATITPRSSSNKILVLCNLNFGGAYYIVSARLYRNGSYITVSGDSSSRPGTFITWGVQGMSNYGRNQPFASFLDSPASTSALTYSIYVRDTRDNNAVYINRGFYDEDSGLSPVGSSSLILMEISA